MSDPKEKIAEILQVHYCDLVETSDYENMLEKNVREYFDDLNLSKQAEYHKALSDEKRLGILKLLEFREMCVCELTAALGVTQPNLTHHIKKLEYAGLVKSERRGKWVYYSLND
jgi:predicted transcriptional regulator